MKKSILALLLVATMLLSLLPMTVFATGTSYAITNGTPESAKEANHGYIVIDKATAAEGETVTVTVKPNEGYQLKSLTVTPAVDKASYTIKEKTTWFSAFSGTTTDKTKITDVVFGKSLPQGVNEQDGVDLTASGTGKVKGYIVANGDNYKIYIVGDYIFGNASCQGMFSGFKNLTTLDFGNFDTSNVTDMTWLFYQCSSLTTLNLSNFDTSSVTNMSNMFAMCSNLISLDLSKFDTSSVTNMSNMFVKCLSLTSLDLSKFNTGKVTNNNDMFQNCAKLASVKIEAANDTIKGQLGNMWAYASGVYTAQAPAVPLTIEFILGTVSDDFPTAADNKVAPDGAWKTTDTNKTCYKWSNEIVFNNQTMFTKGYGRSGVANKSEDGYIYTYSDNTITFIMTDGVLTSIKHDGPEGDGTNYNGTYSAPAKLEYVEIGGVKWATKNLGAEKVTDYGDYFAWGEKAPYYEGTGGWPATLTWKSGKTSGYAWQSYCGSSSFSEWSTPPYDATTKILKPEFDAATQILGNGWRMPTSAEFKALYDACLNGSYDTTTNPSGASASVGKGIYWCTNYDGVAGCLFCDGTNKLFFPAAGYGGSNGLSNAGSNGYYWSSTLHPDTSAVWRMYFYNTGVLPQHYTYRYWGFSVRPVKDAAPANKLLKSSAPKQHKSSAPVDPETITPEEQQDGKYTFTMPARGVTVTAEFEKASNGNFDLCNGTNVLKMKPETDPTWGTYKFAGWYTARTGGTKVETGFTAGTTYYAHWQVSSTDTTLVLTESIYVKTDGVYISTGKLDNINLYGLTFAAAQGDDPVTLTMNNTVVEAGEGTDSGLTFSSSHAFAALSAKIDLKIVLNGQNVLRVTRKVADDSVIALCVGSQKSLTLSGTGSVTADVSGSEGYDVSAVNVSNLINSATLIANAKNTKAKSLNAVAVIKVLTNSGTITASAEGGVSDGGNAVGVMANESIKNTAGTITGYGGIGEYSDGLSIATGSLEITGGKVIGYGGTGVSEYYGVWAAGDITVSGTGVLEAHSGTKQGADPVALHLEATGKTITISDSGKIVADADVKNDGTWAAFYDVTGADVLVVNGSVPVLSKSGSLNIEIKKHSHNLIKVTGKAATEEEAGFNDYYECKDSDTACHKYFEDVSGTAPIEDLAAWKAENGNGYIAPLVHSITSVNGKNATDTEAGYKLYYECKNCGKYYEDATGLIEITDIDAWKSQTGKGYIPSGNEINAAKTAAKAALDSENAKDALLDETALTNGKSAIDSAETLADIENAKNAAITAIQQAQATELAGAKTNAKSALDTEEAKDPLTDKAPLITGKSNIDSATTKAAVEDAKNAAITAIQQAQASELANAKADAKAALDAEEAKAPLTDKTALTNGKNSIDSAATKAAVEIAKTNAITAIQQAQKAEHDIPEPPQDGDNSNMTLWVILMVLSSLGLCACLARGKKRNIMQ